jgi:hypothetical protein
MLLISLGPRPDVYLAYAPEQPTQLPAGTAGVPKEVSVFYGETRGRVFPWTFSLVSIIAPIVVFAAATYLAVKCSMPVNWSMALRLRVNCQSLTFADFLGSTGNSKPGRLRA